jgi:glycerophosphoryl diester phosphodiesterase
VYKRQELERTSSLSGFLRQKSWAELRQADAGTWFSPAFAGERIPTLAETLAFLRESRLIGHLELKDPHLFPNIEAQVADLIRAHDLTDFVQVRSFYHEALHRFHAYAPEIAVSELWFDRVPTAEESHFPTVDLAYPLLLNGDGLARLHALGKKVSAWTVNDPVDGQQLVAAGLDALATDFPDRFLP